MDDPRGNLALEYLALADRLRPQWLVWENVPGILSSTSHDAPDPRPPENHMGLVCDGTEVVVEDEYESEEVHAFNCFLAGLSELGYGFAYRVLDAQYFGLAQRRKRVFVVGYLGDWRRAAAVLFESEGLSGYPAPSREAGTDVAGTIGGHTGGSRTTDLDGHGAYIIDEHNGLTSDKVGTLLGEAGAKGNRSFAVACVHGTQDPIESDIAFPLGRNRGQETAVAFEARYARNGRGAPSEVVPPLKAQSGETGKGDAAPLIANGMTVRHLTPREHERLQGFPDGYTLITNYRRKLRAHEIEEMAAYLGLALDEAKEIGATPDGPRYCALGNSMAVPVMRWIGERIQMVEDLLEANH
jgi:DNA (cytosine-5)-methyltransferase 1